MQSLEWTQKCLSVQSATASIQPSMRHFSPDQSEVSKRFSNRVIKASSSDAQDSPLVTVESIRRLRPPCVFVRPPCVHSAVRCLSTFPPQVIPADVTVSTRAVYTDISVNYRNTIILCRKGVHSHAVRTGRFPRRRAFITRGSQPSRRPLTVALTQAVTPPCSCPPGPAVFGALL